MMCTLLFTACAQEQAQEQTQAQAQEQTQAQAQEQTPEQVQEQTQEQVQEQAQKQTQEQVQEQVQTQAQESETEPQTYSEGVYTKCEVAYTSYDGDHKSIFLEEGDKIAVIAPSSFPTEDQVKETVEGLKQWGYEPVEGEHVYAEVRALDDCISDLKWALEDESIKAIFCVRGGYGASEVMDEVAADLIAESDKMIIGYSDITVCHSAWTAAGVPSVQAAMSGAFEDFPEACLEAEENILKGNIPSYKCESNSYCINGEAEGILIGGNLSTFTSVLESDFDSTKIDKPYIIFLEDIEENVQHIHRYLTILKHCGVLDNAEGIIFGEWVDEPEDLGDYDGSSRGGEFTSVSDMISREFLEDVDIPVAFDFPAGHGTDNYPLLMGETVHLNVTDDSFTIEW